MKNCTSCFKKPKLLPSSKGMMEGCPLGCKDSKSCCISCGKSSKFLSMSISKEAFSKSTGQQFRIAALAYAPNKNNDSTHLMILLSVISSHLSSFYQALWIGTQIPHS